MKRAATTAWLLAVTCVGCIYSDWALTDGRDAGPSTGDGAVVPQADGGGGCDALLCESFDVPQLASRLELQHPTGNRLDVAPFADAPSPPSVLVAARGPTGTGAAYVTKRIGGRTLSRATISARIRVAKHDAAGSVCVLGLSFNDDKGTEERTARILLAGTHASVQEKTGGASDKVLGSHAFTAPAIDAFHRLELSVTVGRNVVVRIDDAVVLDDPLDPSWTPSAVTRIVAGINFADASSTGYEVHVDDLRFDGS